MRSLVPGTRPPPIETRETWLVVETRDAFRYIQNTPLRPSIVVARFGDLSASLVDRVQPELIICPLMANGFDAMDVLSRAKSATWRASICVLTPPLPNQKMVERELKSHASGLRVDLLIV